jgi:general secretion pathway protein K
MAKSPDLMMRFSFPNGESVVELIPETGKLSLNIGTAQEFNSLLLALGAAPEQAAQVASAVVQWRGAAGGAPAGGTGSPTTATSPYDSSQSQTFQPRYSSFLNEEEALYLSGMTPDLFHGNYVRTAQGLARLGALKDCVSVFGTTGRFEVNSADPALLVSLGMSPDAANQIVALRRTKRIMDLNEVAGYAGQAANKLRTGGNTIYTFRATARLRLANGRLSDLRRTVAAQVKFQQAGSFPPHHILRWHEMPYSEVSQWP